MNGKTISNFGSPQDPKDAVRRKYTNEKFFQGDAPIDMEKKPIKNVLSPVDEGDVATKAYCDTKLSLLGGNMQGDIAMGGHLIRHLGEPTHQNEGTRNGCVDENFLKRDGSNWMRNDLSLDGFRVRGLGNPQTDQDGVNLRTLQASEARVLQEAPVPLTRW